MILSLSLPGGECVELRAGFLWEFREVAGLQAAPWSPPVVQALPRGASMALGWSTRCPQPERRRAHVSTRTTARTICYPHGPHYAHRGFKINTYLTLSINKGFLNQICTQLINLFLAMVNIGPWSLLKYQCTRILH
ncbi:hypothetical protein ANANG_G00183140 [Anguilla anguilla]|uniref:Uncharacterized protein n=1 Tax=Anguilla anguilla TaxID=7936 RepID=A0A9D3M5N4_ANGAN|nr:hypothetical protein ANANG_G00183140 [Anguilla anguilla]